VGEEFEFVILGLGFGHGISLLCFVGADSISALLIMVL